MAGKGKVRTPLERKLAKKKRQLPKSLRVTGKSVLSKEQKAFEADIEKTIRKRRDLEKRRASRK